MTRIRSHGLWSIGILVLAGGLLTGCPKRPEVQTAQPPTPASASGGATGVGGASGGVIGGGAVDGTAGAQSGTGAAGAGAGGAGAAGTGGAAGQAGGQIGAGGTAGAGAGSAGSMAGGAGTGTAGTGDATGTAGGAGQPATDGGMTASAATGSGSGSVGGGGLPAGPPTGTTLPGLPSPADFVEARELGDIHFDFDKADIRATDRTVLDKNAVWLRANANAQVLLEGHCDERGTNEYNLALGERRAKATRDYLASVGVDATRVTVISYGKERPLCNDANEACWGQNRRAHFLVKQ